MTNLKNLFKYSISQSKSILIKRKDGRLFEQIRHTTSGLEMIIEWYCEKKRWMNQKGRETYNDPHYKCGTKTHW